MKTLDCRGFQCPHPVVETRRLLLAEPGDAITVLVGDDIARDNITRMATGMGYTVTDETTEGGYSLTLTPGAAGDAGEEAGAVRGRTVLFVASGTMGSGDDELGRVLLKNFLFTLTEAPTVPDVLLFVNAGVKLATAGAETLEALDKLACRGVDIASCGLCLDFFDLKEQLAVGRVTNMLEIAETLQNAGRVIRP